MKLISHLIIFVLSLLYKLNLHYWYTKSNSVSNAHVLLIKFLSTQKHCLIVVNWCQVQNVFSHILCHSAQHLLPYLLLRQENTFLLVFSHFHIDSSFEHFTCLLSSLGCCHVSVSGQWWVISVLSFEKDPSDSVCQTRWAFSLSNFFQELIFFFFVEDDFDSAEISFLFVSSSFCVIPDAEISFGFANETTVNPKSHGVKTSLLSVIK